MAAVARTNNLIKGKEILFMIEKVAGSNTFVAYGCVSAANITNPGTATEEIACRAGTFVESDGDAKLPTVSLESVRRAVASGDAATNFTDAELWSLVVSGEKRNVKILFGDKIGDQVLTGPGFFNQQTVNGPQSGIATGGVTFNFSEQPTVTTVVA